MKIYSLLTLFLGIIMLFLTFLSLNNNLTSIKSPKKAETVTIKDADSGEKSETEMFGYIVGCVAGEMPALYETEALKAQAVACYTYQKYLKEHGTDEITDSSEIHQAYKTQDELKALWGKKYDSYFEKISSAVESVYGEYLVYNNETALTLYHALSDGSTKNAKEVFGKDLRYLRSVTAPGDRLSPDYMNEKVFTCEEIKVLISENNINVDSDFSIEIENETDDSYVKNISFGNTDLSAEKIREIFSLSSPYFTAEANNDTVVFTSYGKGHGVGMSQYSADYMARQGSSYEEILLHFYSDTELKK